MNKFVLLLIAGLFGLGNFYIGKKFIVILSQLTAFKFGSVVWMIISLLTLASMATLLLSEVNVSGLVGKIGSYWLSIWLLALVIFGLTELILNVAGKLAVLSSQTIAGSWLAAVIVVGLLFSYGSWQAQQLRIKKYQVTINSGRDTKQKLKAVLISDVHLGYVNDVQKLTKIVTKINELKPDVVLIAGDLFDGNFQALQRPEQIKTQFNRLSAKYGTYLCWGNHDAGSTFQKMKELVDGSAITLLEDELTVVGESLIIAGRKDMHPIGSQGGRRKELTDKLQRLDKQLPKIVLDHQPSTIAEYHDSNMLILAGHTHKGQIFPFSLVTNAYFTVDYGYYRENSTSPQVIVSSGVGTWGPPLRIGTQSEIVQIDLTIE
ncbi:metallophosphoesterase [Erwinia sp. CPCC 100877]|nr:metallophosphoesterase [Erwinia sp. CPCC 100877]